MQVIDKIQPKVCKPKQTKWYFSAIYLDVTWLLVNSMKGVVILGKATFVVGLSALKYH